MLRKLAAVAAPVALALGLSACGSSPDMTLDQARAKYACSYEQVVQNDGLTWDDVISRSVPADFEGPVYTWRVLFEELNRIVVRADGEVPVHTTVLIPRTCTDSSSTPTPGS